jgi:hypothetical protein
LLSSKEKSRAFHALVANAINYEEHGGAGFQALADVISRVAAFDLVFSEIGEAMTAIEGITGGV